MSDQSPKTSSASTLQKFQSPVEPKLTVADDLNKEYYFKISNPNARRFSSYPAVAISECKIVQNYGTVTKDVTHEFYNGPETVYSISTCQGNKDQQVLSGKGNHARPDKGKRLIHADGRKVGFTPPSLDGSIVALENKSRSSTGSTRKSAPGYRERQLGHDPVQRLKSAGTDISSEREFLEELKETLQRPKGDTLFDSCTEEWNNQVPLPPVGQAKDVTSSSKPTDTVDTQLSQKDEQSTFIYMTGSANKRSVSRGELKKQRISRTMPRKIPTENKVKLARTGFPLTISGKATEATTLTDVRSYKIRQQYTEDIERKWFMKMVKKAKDKKDDVEWLQRRYDLRLDMFYSPEPDNENQSASDGSDEDLYFGDSPVAMCEKDMLNYATGDDFEMEMEQVFQQSFDAEMVSPIKSLYEGSVGRASLTPISKINRPQNKNEVKRKTLRHFDSTDVLLGNVGELEESSGTDIETVLQNGELQERRCKHKMYRKRRRQQKRFHDATSPVKAEDKVVNSQAQLALENFSIKQLRQMRLKRTKKPKSCRGLAKFRQVANLVLAFIQFKKIMISVRKTRRTGKKSKTKKSRKVKWNNELEVYSKFERQTSPAKEPLREIFMREVGIQLLDDIAKLPIHNNSMLIASDNSDTEFEQEDGQKRKGRSFYKEVQKASVADLDQITSEKLPIIRKRRLSLPTPERPEYISFTLREKISTKRSQRGAAKPKSRSSPKGKNKGKAILSNNEQKQAPRQLPPLIITPPDLLVHTDQGVSSRPSHGSLSPSPQLRPSSTKRSKSGDRRSRPRSRSPCDIRKNSQRPGNEIKIWPEVYRPRSYSASHVEFKQELTIRELLKDADIPAKEVTIQVIERKRNRRRKKMADAAAREERLAFQRKVAEELAERERLRLEELQRQEECRKRAEEQARPRYTSPFVFSGVAWHQKRSRPTPTWTNKELDYEITKLSGLFFEMRDCTYLRRSRKDEAILNRLSELEELKI